MKVAIVGKGGVGKTSVAAALAHAFAEQGWRVLAIDADADSNLASTFGISKKIIPLAEQEDLVEERTGAKSGAFGGFFCLNPKVDDLVDLFGIKIRHNLALIVLGTIKAKDGCFCPENALLKALLRHLILERKEVVILDMEAGLEHLGRGTTQGVSRLVIVLEPGMKSLETAKRIKHLAMHLGIQRIDAVLNKVCFDREVSKIKDVLGKLKIPLIGTLPYDGRLSKADFEGKAIPLDSDFFESVRMLMKRLKKG